MLLLALLACQPVSLPKARNHGPAVGVPDADDAGGSGDGADGGAGDDQDGDDPEPPFVSQIFQLDHLVQVDLTVDATGLASLQANPYAYVSADVNIDGQDFPNVGLRIKGRLGSARPLPQKSAFKLDLLEFGEGARLEGLEKLNLNNMVQDCAKLKELAAYGIHELTGTPAARVAYAEVRLNEEAYGVYSLVEAYDDEFLKRRFEDPSGNLYDGDYFLHPDGSYTLVDFNVGAQDYFELDEGQDVAREDIHAVTTALTGGGDFLSEVGALIDLQQHARFWAATAWTGQYDSYVYYSNNYRVYFDPGAGGRGVFLPWDPDWAFEAGTPLHSLYGGITAGCYNSPTCRGWLQDALADLEASLAESDLQDRVEEAADLIRPALEADPKREHSMEQINGCQGDLDRWFRNRSSDLRSSGL
jgi:spore coat protein CotH